MYWTCRRTEANANFAKFIMRNYDSWLNDPKADKPLLSHQLMKKKVFPELGKKPVFVILIDNLRFDQWKVIEPVLTDYLISRLKKRIIQFCRPPRRMQGMPFSPDYCPLRWPRLTLTYG